MSILEKKNLMRELAEKAKNVHESESMSLPEKKEALDKIGVDLKSASDEIAVYEQGKRLAAMGDIAPDQSSEVRSEGRKSFGELVTESDEFKMTMAKAGSGEFAASIDLKTATNVTEGSTVSGFGLNGTWGAAVTPNFLPGIVDIKLPPLLVADLFAQGTTDSPIVTFLKETLFDNQAAGVAEGAAKPQTSDQVIRMTAQVGKISHYLKMTTEMIQDVPQATSFLNSRMVTGIQQKEQIELLNGAGVPSVSGLLGQSSLAASIAGYVAPTATQDSDIDAVFKQLTQIRTTAWLEPDAILVNPLDWQNIRLRKDKNGQYYSGGPFTGAYGNGGYSNVDALWGVRVVMTPAVPAGTILVGAFADAAQLFRKQGVTVEMTNSNEDDFKNDLVMVRATERLALAVYRPGAFGKVTVS